MQAEERHDSVRHGLIVMLPRLKRFAEILIGEREAGTAFLRRSLNQMLSEQHRYQRGTMLDRWAFAEMYRHWLRELRDHTQPLRQAQAGDRDFEELFHLDEEDLDGATVNFLGHLPPQQRCTLLLVYGEGFDSEDAAYVLDCTPDIISTRLVRGASSLADRLSSEPAPPASATVQMLYPQEQGAIHDRTE